MSPAEKLGLWLSLVERCVRDAEAAGSNPVNPTILHNERPPSGGLFVCKGRVNGAARRPSEARGDLNRGALPRHAPADRGCGEGQAQKADSGGFPLAGFGLTRAKSC